ncbi:single-stranded DNA-binding protein [Malacoplasma iowae]|uniref:single-stranded DNA-binding protein n=1 Tax=Malacoplasma iowae TaxID=2116 RepID=UPI002A18834A|nr:single-stranded DNA-binding protein [Malacoplasma iowae]WPL40388.1 single-stranded DNA-binding protein [Malacoplasma iowae]
MNKVFLAGRLASDPQQFVTQNGITQSRLSIACSDNWNKNETYFFPCVAWQSTANYINTYFKKGDAVVLDGKLIRRSYISKEGKTTYIMEVVIETIKHFGGSRKSGIDQSANQNYSNKQNFNNVNSTNEFSQTSMSEEDIDAILSNSNGVEDDEFDVYAVDNKTNQESSIQSDDEYIDLGDLDWVNELK